MSKKEVKVTCPSCKSGNHRLIRLSRNVLVYQCDCGKKFKAEFERICIACDLIEEDFIWQK